MLNPIFKSFATARVLKISRVGVVGVLASVSTFAFSEPMQLAQSAFRDYKQFDDPGVSDWKASNDKVRTLGGWRTYLKEAQVEAQVESPLGTPYQATTESNKQINTQGSPASDVVPSAHSHHHHQHGGER